MPDWNNESIVEIIVQTLRFTQELKKYYGQWKVDHNVTVPPETQAVNQKKCYANKISLGKMLILKIMVINSK